MANKSEIVQLALDGLVLAFIENLEGPATLAKLESSMPPADWQNLRGMSLFDLLAHVRMGQLIDAAKVVGPDA